MNLRLIDYSIMEFCCLKTSSNILFNKDSNLGQLTTV